MTAAERIERTRALMARAICTRPVWIDCEGNLRIGRSADLIEYLEAINIRTRS